MADIAAPHAGSDKTSDTSTLQINGTTIDATFAEAFPMKATRLVITAHTPAWAMNAAHSLTVGDERRALADGLRDLGDRLRLRSRRRMHARA